MVPRADDYTGFNVDVLFEKKLGSAGALDLEGAFYVFNGDNELLKNHFYALASYLIPAKPRLRPDPAAGPLPGRLAQGGRRHVAGASTPRWAT